MCTLCDFYPGKRESTDADLIGQIGIRLRSDVTVGMLLFRGLDSSSIAAVMRRLLRRDADLHVMAATSSDRSVPRLRAIHG